MKENVFSTSSLPNVEILSSTTDICRDFLRNVCHRDKRCKFRHLTSGDLLASVDTAIDPASSNVTYEFCHDFQNQGCDRHDCKFIHCSADVEKIFVEKKILPLRLKYEFELGVQELFAAPMKSFEASGDVSQEKGRPVCRDFIQRQCRRGKKCRFSHIEQCSTSKNDRSQVYVNQKPDQILQNGARIEEKRMRLLGEYHSEESQSHAFQYMKEENLMLRKEIAGLRKQVSGLYATNELLLEQNAQFRVQKHRLVEQGTAFSQNGKTYENQSTMSVSVPIAMSLSLPRSTQQLANTPGLAGATLITSDALPQVVEPAAQTVSVRTHAAVPAQAHIQFPHSAATIVNTISPSNNHLVDNLQTLTNHQANVPSNQGLHGVPILPQVSLTGPNFTMSQTTIPITQSLVCSIPAMTTSSTSGSVLQNTTLVNGTITPQSPLTLNRPQCTQKIVASGLVGHRNCNIPLEPEPKSIGCINRNMATAQMARATLVTANQQDPSAAQHAPRDLSASIAAVAAQVIAAHAQPSSEIGTAQISLPTVPCVTLAPTIVPVTITTSLPVARMVSSLPLNNSSTGLIATQMEGVGPARSAARVSMVNTCLTSVNSLALNAPHQVISTMTGQQQLSAPINFTINPVPSVP